MQIAVLIPALNEEESLPAVLEGLARRRVGRVVVVDNGSEDRTPEVAIEGGAEVVSEPRRGYGSACLAGIQALRGDPPEVLVILDADGSDDLEELPLLLGPIERGEAELVLSDRTRWALPGSLSPQQRWGNALATALIQQVTGRRYRDMGPLRVIRWEALERLEMRDTNYGWNVEMQIKAARRGLQVVEIPTHYRPRQGGRSKISGSVRGTLRAGVKILIAVGRYRE